MKKEFDIIYTTPYQVEVKEFDERAKSATFVMSDDTIDRMGDSMLSTSFNVEEFMKHPVLVANHNAHESLLGNIGRVLDLDVKQTKVVAKAEWFVGEGNPEADFGFVLMSKGIGAFSHKFIPLLMSIGDEIKHDSEIPDRVKRKNPTRVFKKVDLMEVSQVILPANRNALQKYLKEDFGVESLIAKGIIEQNLVPENGITMEQVVDRLELIERQFIELRNIIKIDSDVQASVDEIATKELHAKLEAIFDSIKTSKEDEPENLDTVAEKIDTVIQDCDTARIEKRVGYIANILKD